MNKKLLFTKKIISFFLIKKSKFNDKDKQKAIKKYNKKNSNKLFKRHTQSF